jgi:hypothetical protein
MQPSTKPHTHSSFLKVSLRGWIAMIIVLTVCSLALMEKNADTQLYNLACLVVGYYFGQSVRTQS